jgi:hypothetical protein
LQTLGHPEPHTRQAAEHVRGQLGDQCGQPEKPLWRPALTSPASRCLMPFIRFAEPKPGKDEEDRPARALSRRVCSLLERGCESTRHQAQQTGLLHSSGDLGGGDSHHRPSGCPGQLTIFYRGHRETNAVSAPRDLIANRLERIPRAKRQSQREPLTVSRRSVNYQHANG